MPRLPLAEVVQAGAAHAAALAAIHAEAFAGRESWTADAFAQQLRHPGTRAWIDPRGGLVLIRLAADEAEILTIGVAPGQRRQGIGRRLLTTASAWAATAGASVVFLEVAATDATACAFYSTAGFSNVGKRTAYYKGGGDALVMKLNLCATTES